MASTRWPFVVGVVAAGGAAALLVAALVEADSTSERTLVALALVALVVLATASIAWAGALRRRLTDPLLERAETASKLSHELKNPLMAIKGLASTGSRMFDQMQDQERREFFELIDEEAARLKRVVDQSSTAMRVDADQVSYDFRDEDLGAIVEEVAWATPHGEHPMSLEVESDLTVELDRMRLSEAVEALVDNAAKFSPPDAPIEVAVLRDEDGSAVVEVADRGPGIPFEHAEDVFDRFASWRPAGYEETPGAGLGLFLARAHVLAHGGRVDVVEREEGGTILRITLPVEG